MTSVEGVAEHAPAKINLALHIVGRRADGYHLVESLCVFTRFGDRIAARHAEADVLEVVGEFAAGVPLDASNLVIRARDAMRDVEGPMRRPVAISLEKNIPVSSGVGGGSSDAAATMRAMAKLHGLEPDPETLARLGIPLGADVPMCVAARPLIARGIGDVIETLADFPALAIVLVNPRVAISTPRVFALLARRENPPLPVLPKRLATTVDLAEWLRGTRNDLHDAALSIAPGVADAIATLQDHGALFARMSGSGATCYGLFAGTSQAEDAAGGIKARRPAWFCVATTTTASRKARA